MRKLLLIFGIIAALLIVGFFILNEYIYRQKQPDVTEIPTPYRGTLTGEYVCLPPPDAGTDPCAPALRTDQDEYYAIDFNLMSQPAADLQEGDRFTASGLITPIEYLSTDHWRNFSVEIRGIFSITDSVQKQ